MAAINLLPITFKTVTRKRIVIVLLLLFLEKAAVAKTSAEVVTNILIQKGDGGKQVADGSGNQDITVIEPVVFLESKISRNTKVFGSATVDLWTSASEAIFDSSTGASGKALVTPANAVSAGNATTEGRLQNRVAMDLGVEQRVGKWTFTPHVGYSTEFDYTSYNGGLSVQRAFAEDNFIVSAGYSLFLDQTLPFDAASSRFLDWQNKTTHSFDVSASQILSPSDLILMGYSFTTQSGFLSGSQNTVDVAGTRVSEVLPNARNRHAASLLYVHGFSDAIALHFDYRFYLDDWGIMAHTVSPSVYFSFADDTALLKISYRLHQQSQANYYQDSFATNKTYMTSDSDLAKFTAHEAGVLVSKTWEIPKGFLKSISITGAALYYTRSNNLNAQVYQFGLQGSF